MVLKVATIILIISLIVLAIFMFQARSALEFPPTMAECPDYWTVVAENTCKNVHGLGHRPVDEIVNFKDQKYNGKSGIKAKCDWARKYGTGITWDGITNNPLCS